MPPEESLYPLDWLRIAEKDLRRASHLLSAKDPEASGFYLQQAVEKFLKAFLLLKGWKLERIHDLEALLNHALVYDSSLELYRAPCQKISGYYFVERYPFLTETGVTIEDVSGSLSKVEGLIEKLRKDVSAK